MYFILNRNSNYSYLSFLTIGLLWWVKWQGAIMLLIVSIIFFKIFKKTPKLFVKYSICLSITLIIVSPMLLDRYEQFGDRRPRKLCLLQHQVFPSQVPLLPLTTLVLGKLDLDGWLCSPRWLHIQQFLINTIIVFD